MPNSTGDSTVLHHLSNCSLSLGTKKPITPLVSELNAKQYYKCYIGVTDLGDSKLPQFEVFGFPLYELGLLLLGDQLNTFSQKILAKG